MVLYIGSDVAVARKNPEVPPPCRRREPFITELTRGPREMQSGRRAQLCGDLYLHLLPVLSLNFFLSFFPSSFNTSRLPSTFYLPSTTSRFDSRFDLERGDGKRSRRLLENSTPEIEPK